MQLCEVGGVILRYCLFERLRNDVRYREERYTREKI